MNKQKKNGYQQKQSKRDKEFHLKNDVFGKHKKIYSSSNIEEYISKSLADLSEKLVLEKYDIAVLSYHSELLGKDFSNCKSNELMYSIPASLYTLNNYSLNSLINHLEPACHSHVKSAYKDDVKFNDVNIICVVNRKYNSEIDIINSNNQEVYTLTYTEVLHNKLVA